ncbi:uncharacterized protein HGUI_01714 [Hanseniaspora guilliermondii]|uniref:Uncharacterized protein n=1 Tax=Hanseniaspora guilliermondii TaxID=56406 RepID=A0A1L0AZF0_9ASCO|nr:uncharacterized protein HGUI_01714 [Hanseniaspora guilliermondii]
MFKQTNLLLLKSTPTFRAGHAKWQNIMHRKNAQDKIKGANSMKYVQQVTMAIKENNNDFNINSNSELKSVMERAAQANVPKKILLNVIEKFKSKDASKNEYKQCIFPVIGKNGVSVIYDIFTDSPLSVKTGIATAVKMLDGSVNTQALHFFDKRGEIMLNYIGKDLEEMDDGQSEDFLETFTMSLIENDVEFEDVEYAVNDNNAVALKVVCTDDTVHKSFNKLKDIQDALSCKVLNMDVIYNPTQIIQISENENKSLLKAARRCLKASEDIPDLKAMYVNFKVEDE